MLAPRFSRSRLATDAGAIVDRIDQLPDRDAAISRVVDYHRRTMHRVDGFARSLGYLDWASQPDPFRRYADTPLVPLDLVPTGGPDAGPLLDELAQPDSIAARPLDRAVLSQLLFDSLALSAWKEHGSSRWSLRVNPSSGNLHPTEGYLLCAAVAGVSDAPGLFHYAPFHHALEPRFRLSPAEWALLGQGLPTGSILLGLTSIHWRESWKYGERAYRYCQHDVGHAIAAVTMAAAAMGWQARLLQGIGDDGLALLLGVHQQAGIEKEHPDALLVLYPRTSAPVSARLDTFGLPDVVGARLRRDAVSGAPNALSRGHHDWPILDEVAASCRWPAGAGTDRWSPPAPLLRAPRALAARPLIRQRRSAVAMDGRTPISRAAFYRMLERLHPASAPFGTLPWRPAVHLAIFVHRVDALPPGLYLLVRDHSRIDALRSAMRSEFRWSPPPGCPDGLGLWTLALGACDNVARSVSCGQDIAADGVFALGMLAEFEPRLRAHGPWFYRGLHWETGLVGQVLYLEAEAVGLRATGIGCFLDDLMHEVLGLSGSAWQTLYHFAVGGAVDDARLRTLDPYAHR